MTKLTNNSVPDDGSLIGACAQDETTPPEETDAMLGHFVMVGTVDDVRATAALRDEILRRLRNGGSRSGA